LPTFRYVADADVLLYVALGWKVLGAASFYSQMIVLDQETTRMEIPLPIGRNAVPYPKDLKIQNVQIRGMRNRPVNLKRVPWKEFLAMNRTLRGFPSVFSLNFREHLIGIWPAPLQTYELLIDTTTAAEKDEVA